MNDKEFDKYIEKYGGRYYPKTREEFNKRLDEILESAKTYDGAAEAGALDGWTEATEAME